MRNVRVCSLGVLCVVGLLASEAALADTTLSLQAVAINGTPLGEPSTAIQANPGDVIEVEAMVRDWSPAGQRLRGFQISLDYASYFSGSAGDVLPVNFSDTTDVNGLCCCGGTVGDPNSESLFIESSDSRYIHEGVISFPVTDVLNCSYRLAGATLFASDGPISAMDGTKKYCGTFLLEVSADASGTFTVQMNSGSGSFLRDEIAGAIEPLALESLSIDAGGDACAVSIAGSVPASGAIDARQPSTLDCLTLFGWDSIDLDMGADASCVTVADFDVTSTAPGGAPGVVSVSAAGNILTLNLEARIPRGAWTTFTHTPSGSSTTLGFLPADVTNDGTAGPLDVLALIDFLNGVGPALEMFQGDANQSGAILPDDILRVIDLLNGAGCLDVWNGASLP